MSAKLNYLGHTIGSGNIMPQQYKIQAVLDFPVPSTRKQVKSFLDLAEYWEHIPAFSAPLDAIAGSKNPTRVKWNSTLDQAFKNLKQAFQEAQVL